LPGEFAIPKTADGDDILELVRTGTLDSFSVGFKPVRDRLDGDVVTRVEAALMEVSAVGCPAYEGALIGGIRAASQPLHIPRAVALARRELFEW
jgi:HK97 family phage prohead protease